jgi:hypothetical protein
MVVFYDGWMVQHPNVEDASATRGSGGFGCHFRASQRSYLTMDLLEALNLRASGLSDPRIQP